MQSADGKEMDRSRFDKEETQLLVQQSFFACDQSAEEALLFIRIQSSDEVDYRPANTQSQGGPRGRLLVEGE
ncbi:MAG: hypothetical protein VX958_03765 [Planctomycetota bacterium]|nr:hypothetical protein [Planctomycetota bacterium]